jgi:hypothetical protein
MSNAFLKTVRDGSIDEFKKFFQTTNLDKNIFRDKITKSFISLIEHIKQIVFKEDYSTIDLNLRNNYLIFISNFLCYHCNYLFENVDKFKCSNQETVKKFKKLFWAYAETIVNKTFELNNLPIPMQKFLLQDNFKNISCESYFDKSFFDKEAQSIIGEIIENDLHLQTNFSLLPIVEAIRTAVKYGHLNIIQFLEKIGVIICMSDTHTPRILELCAQYGHTHILQYFIEKGYVLDDKVFDLFYLGIVNGNINIVKYLVNQGHDSECSYDLLKYSFKFSYFSITSFLLECGYKIEYHNGRLFGGVFLKETEEQFIPYLTKRQQFAYRELDFSESVLKNLDDHISTRRAIKKHNFLKFILKPMSLHMQLTSIE